jgi:transcriptional regulator of acetoin/glycerol metabolism
VGDTFDDSGAPRPSQAATFAAQFVVLLECDRPLAGGARSSLEGVDLVTIGRGPSRAVGRRKEGEANALDVSLPGRSLSQAHARLVRLGASWALEDLGSRNGTSVNGQRITHAVLRPDDVFEVGHTFCRVNPAAKVLPATPFDADLGATRDDPRDTLDAAFGADLEALVRIARSDVPILVLGESGTGKERLARWMHALAGREGSFVAVNCGAIPGNLVEGTFFGHVKGSFSGALRDEPGLVRAAHKGTLFLDEIADLPKDSQAALLRVLQEREVTPVGASRPVQVDLRVVAATHQPIEDMMRRGEFRGDLFSRVAGFRVEIPALRDRRDDFGVLVASILRKLAGESAGAITLAPEAGEALLAYDWPLNVRELEQCLAAAIALASGDAIERSHLPSKITSPVHTPAERVPEVGELTARDERLRLELLEQLSRHEGNLAEVARSMNKARMQIHRWCRRFGVNPNAYRK